MHRFDHMHQGVRRMAYRGAIRQDAYLAQVDAEFDAIPDRARTRITKRWAQANGYTGGRFVRGHTF